MENQDKINLIKEQIKLAEESIRQAKEELARLDGKSISKVNPLINKTEKSRQVVEGFFNGQNMVDEKMHEYPVPANYASKSKLVEGDRLKLVITNDGSFIYKQIGPVKRKRVVGTLIQQENGDYFVLVDGKSYRVLLASVTYFKTKTGDEVTLLIPSDRESVWGAIENIFINHSSKESSDDLSKAKNEEETKIENSAEDIEDEWSPDLDEIEKEKPDEIKNEENFEEDEFEFGNKTN